jgi:hypothetical protein
MVWRVEAFLLLGQFGTRDERLAVVDCILFCCVGVLVGSLWCVVGTRGIIRYAYICSMNCS